MNPTGWNRMLALIRQASGRNNHEPEAQAGSAENSGALPEVPNSLGLHGRDRFDL